MIGRGFTRGLLWVGLVLILIGMAGPVDASVPALRACMVIGASGAVLLLWGAYRLAGEA